MADAVLALVAGQNLFVVFENLGVDEAVVSGRGLVSGDGSDPVAQHLDVVLGVWREK